MNAYETVVNGKWILAGEHAVLRGVPALVFPLQSRSLNLKYIPDPKKGNNLTLEMAGEHGEELRLLFWGVLERALELRKVRRNDVGGSVTLTSSLPVGAGLGASAALCVAVSRFFQHLKFVKEEEMSEFARQLENLFHGESSGLDIAVAMSGEALRFQRGAGTSTLEPQWRPMCYLSYSGQRGVTVQCVKKVKELFNTDAKLAAEIDQKMKKAVELCEAALENSSSEKSFANLKEGFKTAAECFKSWGLISSSMQSHIDGLKSSGAVAVKPTGSGDGGYILSLWDKTPSAEILKKLTPCF